MKATEVYAAMTARTISGKTFDWIRDLVERFGDDQTTDAIEDAALDRKFPIGTVLSRARDALARASMAPRPVAPFEVDRDWLVAIIREKRQPPEPPWIYDTRELTRDEYTECIEWSTKKLRP